MGEDEAKTNGGPLNIQRALDIARNTEGDLDPAISSFLESMLSQLWDRIESEPDRYILTKDEFAVFNFFITRFNGSEKAEKAIARYWRSHQE